MPESLEDRVSRLEQQNSVLKGAPAAPPGKDIWDKLSALSTVLSGVIIASIGIWVNHSLTAGQQRSEDAQATASRQMEEAHNTASDLQAKNALQLQARQTADALDFQKLQARNQQELAKLQMQQQMQQASDTLKQQQQQNDASLKVQRVQLDKDFMPQIASADPKSRASVVQLVAEADPEGAILLSKMYLETSADTSLVSTSESVLVNLQKSSNSKTRADATTARAEVVIATRIQAITNVFEAGKQTRVYDAVYAQGGLLEYGGIFIFGGASFYELLSRYCAAAGAQKADAFRPLLARVQSKDPTLVQDQSFAGLLKDAAQDPIMQQTQDQVFDELYWKPAQTRAATLGLKLPLSVAAIFDTGVNLGPGAVTSFAASATTKLSGDPSRGVDEKAWTTAFVDARMASMTVRRMPNGLLRRVAFYRSAIDEARWTLDLPLTVMSVQITR